MAEYTVAVRVAFGNNAFDASPTWNAVTSDVKGFNVHRGRQYEMGRMEAGTSSVILNNTSGNYWKNNASGSYYPNVIPMKPVNVQVTYNGTTYNIFTGFSENWTPGFIMPPIKGPEVTLNCVDLVKSLARNLINNAGYAQELSGTRVGHVLDSLGWPAGLRTIATGVSTLQATGTNTNLCAQQHLFDIQNTEQGIVFVGVDGKVVFHDRHSRQSSPYNASQYTFTDAGKCYSGIVPTNDDQYIYNEVRVTRKGGTEQVATDAGSQTSYGLRSLALTGLLTVSDGESLSCAQYLVSKYAQPAQRVKQLIVNPSADPANLWPIVVGLDISSRITVVLTQASINEDYYIEGITHTYRPGQPWVTTYDLSPASNQVYWSLGDTGFSELGDTTVLSY